MWGWVVLALLLAILAVVAAGVCIWQQRRHGHNGHSGRVGATGPPGADGLQGSTGGFPGQIIPISLGPIGPAGILVDVGTGGGLAIADGMCDGAGTTWGPGPSNGFAAMANMAFAVPRACILSNLTLSMTASTATTATAQVAVWTSTCATPGVFTQTALSATQVFTSTPTTFCFGDAVDQVSLNATDLMVIFIESLDNQLLVNNLSGSLELI